MLTIERQNDYVLTWRGMIRATDGAYVNDATVTLTLKVTATDAAVSGISGLSMSYVSDSNGAYQGRIPASALPSSLTLGSIYTMEVIATSGSFTGFIKEAAQLVERTS